jgi:hypothetical protein
MLTGGASLKRRIPTQIKKKSNHTKTNVDKFKNDTQIPPSKKKKPTLLMSLEVVARYEDDRVGDILCLVWQSHGGSRARPWLFPLPSPTKESSREKMSSFTSSAAKTWHNSSGVSLFTALCKFPC